MGSPAGWPPTADRSRRPPSLPRCLAPSPASPHPLTRRSARITSFRRRHPPVPTAEPRPMGGSAAMAGSTQAGSRRAAARVDLGAIAANVETLRAAAPTAQVLAVVKADAYGHGLVPAASAARRGGAAWLGTALVDEALALRAAGDTGRLLAWLLDIDDPWPQAVGADIDLSVSAPWGVDAAAAAARTAGRPARLHLKVDT